MQHWWTFLHRKKLSPICLFRYTEVPVARMIIHATYCDRSQRWIYTGWENDFQNFSAHSARSRQDTPELHDLKCLPVKYMGLALPTPTKTKESNYKASSLICSHLISAIYKSEKFCSLTHLQVLNKCKAALQEQHWIDNDAKFDSLMTSFPWK